MYNFCVRCGKKRVEGKTWKGKIGASTITYIQTVCPDKECQKIVDETTAQRKAKNALMIEEKAKAKLAREKSIAASS